MTYQPPSRAEAADQRLTAAVRDAAKVIRTGSRDPELAETDRAIASYILTAAGYQAERILGPGPRGYAQTFRVGKP